MLAVSPLAKAATVSASTDFIIPLQMQLLHSREVYDTHHLHFRLSEASIP